MKKSRFTAGQITSPLQQPEAGTPLADLAEDCRKIGVTPHVAQNNKYPPAPARSMNALPGASATRSAKSFAN